MTHTSWLLQVPRTKYSVATLTNGDITTVIHDAEEWNIPPMPLPPDKTITFEKKDGSHVMLFDGLPDWLHILDRKTASQLVTNLNFNGRRFFLHTREHAAVCLLARRNMQRPVCLLVVHARLDPTRLYLYLRRQETVDGVPTLAYIQPEDIEAWMAWLKNRIDAYSSFSTTPEEHPFYFVRTARILL